MTWTCDECQNENDDVNVCEACEAPRPTDPRYANYRVGRVLKVEAIAKTKLMHCEIDVGSGEPIMVVTNAKNIKLDAGGAGLLVVVACEGAVVTSAGEETVIKKTAVQGKKSEGMLCDAPMLWGTGSAGSAVLLPAESFKPGDAPPSTRPTRE